MKVKFDSFQDKTMFRFVPIGFSISKRGLPHRHAFYISCELGYWRFCVQFKWYTKEDTDEH